ncbi:helix-turn-helix domain-containing protein [Halobacteriovorax sp. GFR7]|uniref:helix-turn-helix domain-containing protein n=1 Tax=unclassified Halobacteriovorax TaxID=2639665 RepID=UPI003D988CF1
MKDTKTIEINRFLTIKEASEMLGLKINYIYNLVNSGELKAYRCGNKPGGALRFILEDLYTFMGVEDANKRVR